MQTLQINESVDLMIVLPDSVSTDAPTYEIFDADGTVIQSGSLEFIRDEIWKVSDFTPDDVGLIVLKATNATEFITQKRQNYYRVGRMA